MFLFHYFQVTSCTSTNKLNNLGLIINMGCIVLVPLDEINQKAQLIQMAAVNNR